MAEKQLCRCQYVSYTKKKFETAPPIGETPDNPKYVTYSDTTQVCVHLHT